MSRGPHNGGAQVRRYLEWLNTRGAKTTNGKREITNPAAVERNLARINAQLETEGDVLLRLKLYRQRAWWANKIDGQNASKLEDDFVEVAARYAKANEIPYTAWRDMGVPVDVLTRAGITNDTKVEGNNV